MHAWLEVEVAACAAMAELGEIPPEALREIKERATIDVARVREIEEATQHEIIAFLTDLAERVGEPSRYIHRGMTSQDVLDTGLALQLKRAGHLLAEETRELGRVLQRRALEHRDTIMVGRTHGVHAEPITFGLVLALWAFDVKRDLERLERATHQVAVGKISGAVGTYATVDPHVERMVMTKLGLTPAPVSNQSIQRDRHAEFVASLALLGSTIEKIALEVRNLQRTEVLEAEEYFAPGQKGSSAMPHKRNPIMAMRLTGLARVLRGYSATAMENIALWHEHDISHSSAERIILPDSAILAHYMLKKAIWLVDTLVVHPATMRANLEQSHGLVYSQRVLLALVGAGMLRDEAYAVVQRAAMRAWEQRRSFKESLLAEPEVARFLSEEALDRLFEPGYYLRNATVLFDRVARLTWEPAPASGSI